jgi:hypothetical protein
MVESIPILFLTGLVLGLQHAFEPDHLVAVSVFAVEGNDLRRSAWLGFSWGLGTHNHVDVDRWVDPRPQCANTRKYCRAI